VILIVKNMKESKRKICVVVFSRANYARIRSLLGAIQNHPELQLQLIVGASAVLWRFGNILETIANDGFEVSEVVYSIVDGGTPGTMAKSTGLSIIELATTFENLKPDIVLTVADRFETMATAITASYMNIPVAHTQGGEVTGSIDESVRHAITKLAHIHFPATQESFERLIKMGEDPDTVYVTGCPAMDIVAKLSPFEMPNNIFSKFGVPTDELNPHQPFLLVLQHPVTTEFGDGLQQINNTLDAVESIGMPTVWIWPNADAGTDDVAKGMRMHKEDARDTKIHYFLNFTPEDYVYLLANCSCIIGNSSSGIREGAFLGTPSVNIGSRQHNRERGNNVIDVSYDSTEIKKAIHKQLEHGRYEPEYIFGEGDAGEKIADVLSTATVNQQKAICY